MAVRAAPMTATDPVEIPVKGRVPAVVLLT
jgi:hypothetical protein